ncbi:class I SAM-dependent DNA methyltransferase [Gloeobacter kilaueensis]|uniref:Type 12 methyltransferase n=1 Tax=Gloeobacter kilaueensis (strain ATCC BAA-2537 / CCAP 1431/1 / ULC 316 / JS1) TaxID=1183438 RepID=U5QSF6_GLOK1|nr:class I SAM-dependent methyltransferase [Gloeobacter kilaueensis]AGY60604.1 type 12 methyltransferase [Gloeobacter kilaueensis JS1]
MQPERPSLMPAYFEALYRESADPWNFETSAYEDEKYSSTLAVLPRSLYRRGFEIGCSIGVLTARLARRCEALLSIDVSQKALDRARQRCRTLPQVHFEWMRVPERFPDGSFDLIILSEVGYYWSWSELRTAQQLMLAHLEPGGHLLLVHWTLFARDYPLTGDEVHDAFVGLAQLKHLQGQRAEQYRLDLFERLPSAPPGP